MFLGHRIFYSSPIMYLFGVQIERNLLSDQKDKKKYILIKRLHVMQMKASECDTNGN